MSFSKNYLIEAVEIIKKIDVECIEKIVKTVCDTRNSGGRIFFLGVGGSAANCSHAVNDFRKIAGIECYTPVDNVSELTARTNDDGWSSVFVEWLKISRLSNNDLIFVLSVGGGSLSDNISPNLVSALVYAKECGAKITGILGRDGGFTAQVADHCLIIPIINPENITPHSEAFQAVIWHMIVSNPSIKLKQTKWENTVEYKKE
jgi:D-sedoheptulose 7-phosphate isomerase